MGKFATKKGKDGHHYFNLLATNGQVILSSEGYTTSSAMHSGIESVKKNSTDDNRFEKFTSKSEKYYFNLKATNGQIIGKSELYESTSGRDNGIESVKKNAPDATVIEEE